MREYVSERRKIKTSGYVDLVKEHHPLAITRWLMLDEYCLVYAQVVIDFQGPGSESVLGATTQEFVLFYLFIKN